MRVLFVYSFIYTLSLFDAYILQLILSYVSLICLYLPLFSRSSIYGVLPLSVYL